MRRRFIRFMVDEFDRGRDLKTSMNVLRAVRWGIEAREQDITSTTIQNCWIRSQAYDWGGTAPTIHRAGDEWSDSRATISEITNNINQLEKQGQFIKKRMNVIKFLNPIEEEIHDGSEDVVQEILARYGPEREAESDEEVIQKPPIKTSEILEALATLRLAEEQKQYRDAGFSKRLRLHEAELREEQQAAMHQSNIIDWFGDHSGVLGGFRGAS